MKKIYINNTKRTLFFGDTMLLTGSNLVDPIDEKKFPTIKALVENGDVEITDDALSGIRKANTQETVDKIEKASPKDEKVKAAAGKRKAMLDEMDEEAKELLKQKAKEDAKAEGDEK